MQIEAFVSPTVPEEYVQTRMNLLAVLRRVAGRAAAARSSVQIHDTERYTEEAALAEQALRHRAPPRSRRSSHGALVRALSSSTWP